MLKTGAYFWWVIHCCIYVDILTLSFIGYDGTHLPSGKVSQDIWRLFHTICEIKIHCTPVVISLRKRTVVDGDPKLSFQTCSWRSITLYLTIFSASLIKLQHIYTPSCLVAAWNFLPSPLLRWYRKNLDTNCFVDPSDVFRLNADLHVPIAPNFLGSLYTSVVFPICIRNGFCTSVSKVVCTMKASFLTLTLEVFFNSILSIM